MFARQPVTSTALRRIAARPTTSPSILRSASMRIVAAPSQQRLISSLRVGPGPLHSLRRQRQQQQRPKLQQRRLLSDATRQAIDKAIASAPVVLFMKGTPEFPQCGFSRASIQILSLQGVDPAKFAAFNVLEDDELRAGIKEYSEWPTIPQLYINGEFVGGCDILVSMHQNGELAKLLEEKSVLVAPAAEGEEADGKKE